MKIFLTKFIWDGQEYTGPDIHASNHANAELIADDLDDINRPRVLH